MTNLDQSNIESQPLPQPRSTDRRFLISVSGFVHQLCDRITGPAPGSADEFSPPSTPPLSGPFPSGRYRSTYTTLRSIRLEKPGIPPAALRVSKQVTASGSRAGGELGQRNTCGLLAHPTRILPTSDIATLPALPHNLSQRERLKELPVLPSALRISKQVTASGSQAGIPTLPHDLSPSERLKELSLLPSALPVSEPVITSAPQAREGSAKHTAFRDRSEGLGKFPIQSGPSTDILVLPVTSHRSSHKERFHTPVSPEAVTAAQLQGAYGFSISGNPNFTNIGSVNNYGGSHGLEYMENFVSFNAFHNSSVQDPDRKCHPGTRLVVLNRMQDWFDNTASTERTFWLHGPAGAGKSAIAQTIARSRREHVAATFFFYRSDTSRNDGNYLFPTIAWQLAFLIPGIKDHIARTLERRPDLPRMDVETQFEKFILRSFQALKDVSPNLRSLVVIIDGVDECIDEKLQRRFLKLIGNATKDNGFPLRFLICSRPEPHIQETIDRFPKPNLQIDLASLDDANHDIEKYLKDEFSRVASEQGLDSTGWPGDAKIQQVLYKSSGQFVYASTVIRYISDEYNSAVTQLDIVLGLKPPSSKSPFAELDALFLEILERQPDQPFLMTFLTLLVARLSIDAFPYGVGSDDFHFDDAILMNLAEFELHRKLRGMRSLFKFKPFIDLHHRSFLDFLKDPSRSCQFYISQDTAQRRYLELITDSVVRFVEKTIDQPNYHETGHFCPQFYRIARAHPPRINLPVTEWQDVLKPLLCLQDKLLALPNFTSTWNLLPCNTCTVFQIMRHFLLHLIIMQGTSRPATSSIETVELCSDESDVNRSSDRLIAHEDSLAGYMYSLLSQLRMVKLESSVNATTIQLMCSLLHFDYTEIAKRVNSIADAQFLMDFIDSLTNDDYFRGQCGPDTAFKLVRLALEIYTRVPVLPRSVFSDSDICSGYGWCGRKNKDFETRCQTALLRRIADHNYVVPLLWIHESDSNLWVADSIANKSKSLKEWRNTSKPSAVEKIRVMLSVAKVIQYLHSIDVVFDREIDLDHIFLDSNLHARIRMLCSTSRSLTETPASFFLYGFEKKWNSYETNIFIFGCFFYEIYFDKRTWLRWECNASAVSDRPSEPTIREEAWQLIQRCCAKDQKARPSMNEVVQEMESWNLVPT